ncbi:pyocin knob domain-containing protein [Achromobacter kerstersii]
MANIENINVGLAANDKKGDPLRDAMQKANRNFSALNSAVQGVLDTKGQANGFASLGADGRLLAAQAPVVYSAALPTAAHDLNTYVTPGTFYQTTVAGASSPNGVNYPVAQVGFLEVVATGTPVLQVYTTRVAGMTSQRFWRTRISSASWSSWKEVVDTAALTAVKTTADAAMLGANAAIPTAQKASANGVGSLDASGRQPIAQLPAPIALPITAHDLDTYDQDGTFGQNATAGAVTGINYPPEKVAGVLTVQRGGANNILAHQWYRTYFVNNSTIYYRNKVAAGWGDWVRLAKFNEAMTHTFLTTATDANTLAADNTFYTFTSATPFTGGLNWPPTSNIIGGLVEVAYLDGGRVIQTCTLPVSNGKPRIFQRFGDPRASGTWQTWRMIGAVSSTGWLPSADAGDVYVDGLGWHKWNGSAYELTSLAVLLPTAAHNLDTYVTPGDWYQGAAASASVANNYPVGALTGFLTVKTFGTATLQEYTNRATTNQKFWRTKTGASTWSVWSEAATTSAAMTHTFLTVATDANSLTADNTFYTWTGSAIPGANFPGYQAAGYMQVFWHAATMVSQELTLLVTGGKPLKFARFGNSSTGTWQPWKVTSAFNSASWMPASDMGDIYVDGLGWHSWNGSSYKLTFAGKDHGQCQFQYVSGTQCRLVPWHGNGLIINGRQERIPAAGVNLANTLMPPGAKAYVYAYMVGAIMTLEVSSSVVPVTHTDGVVIKTGDPSRTLVGMAIVPASDNLFRDNSTERYVASWFNRRTLRGYQYATPATTSDSYVTLNGGVSYLTWARSVIKWTMCGQTSSSNRSGSYIGAQVNGTGSGGNAGYSLFAASQMAFSFGGSYTTTTDNLYTVNTSGLGTGPAGTVGWAFEQTTECEG